MSVNNQNRTKNWFSASKAIFEMETLSEHDIIVYLYLCRCIEEPGQGFPSRSAIARACKISVRTVDRALKNLEAAKLVKKTVIQKPGGGFETNWYDLFDPPEPPMQENMQKRSQATMEEPSKNTSVLTRLSALWRAWLNL